MTPVNSSWPRISLVTAVYNGETHLEETICSVLGQSYPNLEYIIVDDGSTDRTPEIVKKYEHYFAWWTSQPNQGMYASLNIGFARSTGEVLGWLNDSDMLHPGGLSVVGSVFRDLPVEWITGRPTHFNEEGQVYNVDPVPRWTRIRFLAGFNRYIQQESTFWRRSLWEKAGGYVDASGRYGHVADFELWVRFFRHARLYPVDALIGGFRMDRNSRGLKNLEACHEIHDQIIAAELDRVPQRKLLKSFRALNAGVKKIPVLRYAWWRLVERSFYTWPGRDCPPVIRYDAEKGWHLES
jgi:glycosyltransferase involved in cell wall biosynthesis